MIVFKNGRMMEVPDTGVLGSEIMDAAEVTNGRVAVSVDRGRVRAINAGKRYLPDELKTRSGKFVRIEDMPDRSKGGGELIAA